MLKRLVEFSLTFRGVVMALACTAVGYGIYATLDAKYDVYPEFAPPQVVIQTEAPGLSPEEVEALVTRPVEAVLNGVPELRTIRSQSVAALRCDGHHTASCRERMIGGRKPTYRS